MKRLHVHVSVDDLAQSTRFYSTLFAAEPTVVKDDYVKWMLDDPRVNFAISTRAGRAAGISHLGIQAEDETELAEVYERLSRAERPIVEAKERDLLLREIRQEVDRRSAGCAVGDLLYLRRSTVYGEGSLAKLKEVNEARAARRPAASPRRSCTHRTRRQRQLLRALANPQTAMMGKIMDTVKSRKWCARVTAASPKRPATPIAARRRPLAADRRRRTPASKSREMGYSEAELAAVPEGANLGLGCGNPQAIAALRPGEVVIDLGSGAGFDCFLAAQQVGAHGSCHWRRHDA